MKKLLRNSNLLPWLALGAISLLVLLDIVVFWAFNLRPVISTPELEIIAWSVLAGTALTAGLRLALRDEGRVRWQIAVAMGLMAVLFVAHPWENGAGRDADPLSPSRTMNPNRVDDPGAIIEFEGGPLTKGEKRQA
jgi:hypothetical protein